MSWCGVNLCVSGWEPHCEPGGLRHFWLPAAPPGQAVGEAPISGLCTWNWISGNGTRLPLINTESNTVMMNRWASQQKYPLPCWALVFVASLRTSAVEFLLWEQFSGGFWKMLLNNNCSLCCLGFVGISQQLQSSQLRHKTENIIST